MSKPERLVPFNRPHLGKETIEAVTRVLRSGWLTTGPVVARFEHEFAQYTGARHAIAVNSCTAALEIAFKAVGVGPGDEVIVPTMTYCATASAAVACGATPVLVDVGPTGHISPTAVAQALTGRTKAIAPVHYAGAACDLDALRRASYGVPLVEDAAHAVGATYDRQRPQIGAEGIACFSFYATKNLTCGEGGMIAVNDDELAEQIRLIAGQGIRNDSLSRFRAGEWEYDVLVPGMKANMSDVHAVIGLTQLQHLEGMNGRRRQIAEAYGKAFEDSPIQSVPNPGHGLHARHLYPVQVPDRNGFRQGMLEAGIDTSVHFIPLHRMTAFKADAKLFPEAERLYAGLVSLPIYPAMTPADVRYVIDTALNLTTTPNRTSGQLQ